MGHPEFFWAAVALQGALKERREAQNLFSWVAHVRLFLQHSLRFLLPVEN